jgi:hypothetical protein
MREKLTIGDIPFRKAYLGSLVDRIEVDDGEVRIVGKLVAGARFDRELKCIC